MDLPVEIKITVAGDVGAALLKLSLGKAKPRRIYFLEANGGGGSLVPLLDAHIVLRLRHDEDEDDSTVKLRPWSRPSLIGQWAEGFQIAAEQFEYKVEADWAGSRRSIAASAVTELTLGRVEEFTAGNLDPTMLFTSSQRQFLDDCAAGHPVDLRALTSYGPILASKWPKFQLPQITQKVAAERWMVGTLDFLELSIRVEPGDDAETTQEAFADAVQAQGLPFERDQETKTRTVLEEMVRQRIRP